MGPTDPNPLNMALQRDDATWAREHLASDIVAWLTTVAPDGQPQASVIGFLHDGDGILFYSEPDTLKLRNIAHSPQVSFNLQADPYGDHYLIVEGTAVIDPTVVPSDRHPAYRPKYHEPNQHWGMDDAQVGLDFSVPIRIIPRRVRVA